MQCWELKTFLYELSISFLFSPVNCIVELHCWIAECIDYKLLSLTYKLLTTTLPPYLHNLISVQRPRSTRSSSIVTVARPPSLSCLKITDCSFSYVSLCLWNQLPLSLSQPHSGTSSSISDSPILSPNIFPLLIHHSAHRLLHLNFIPGLIHTCYTNPTPIVSLLS